MSEEIILTKKGKQKVLQELAELKGPKRHAITEAIREARGHGDLKENAAYHEAKLNQSRLEARIADLEKLLEVARVDESDAADSAGFVALGCRVGLQDLQWDEEMALTLVGAFEADPDNGMISVGSPLGKALLGKVPGDEIQVETPGGLQSYRILRLET